MTKQAWKKVEKIIDFAGKVVVLIGLPLAIIQFNLTSKKERNDREYEIYNTIGDAYADWEKLCLNYPHLDIFDIKDSIPIAKSPKEEKEELILFTILFSLFERAYVLYKNESTSLKKNQWSGWNQYIMDYCTRENFRKAWKISGTTYEVGFQNYMDDCIKKVGK